MMISNAADFSDGDARFKDAAGNISATANDTIDYDSTAPGVTSFVINADATYANTTSVTLTVSASDAGSGISQMMISNAADFSDGVWESFVTSKSWTLNSTDGTKNVYIKLRDTVLNVSETATDSIILDTENPTGTISVNFGDATTASRDVTLSLAASDTTSGITEMMISESPTFAGASWEPYTTTKSYTLSASDGLKIVYVKFNDEAGNVSEVVNDAITQDTTAPTVTSYKINNGASYAKSKTVSIKFSVADATSTVASMEISTDNTFADTTWVPYTTDSTYIFTGFDGAKVLYARFKDNMGNISPNVHDTIFVDTTMPSGSISINAGAATTSTVNVTLALAASDAGSGIATMQISTNATLDGASARETFTVDVVAAPAFIEIEPEGMVVSTNIVSCTFGEIFPMLSLKRAYKTFAPSNPVKIYVESVVYGTHVVSANVLSVEISIDATVEVASATENFIETVLDFA
jgi:hypothetical protein